MSGVKGKSGRKKTPLAILKRRGSRLDRRSKNEMEVDPDFFIEPAEMSAGVRSFYDTWTPILRRMKILSVTDSLAFELLARTYARMKALEKLLGDEDECKRLFVNEQTKQGNVVRISAITRLQRDFAADYKSQLASFGLNPAARGNVTKIEIKRDGIKKLT